MPQETTAIETGDGSCTTHVFTPEGKGPWPGVILFMDAFAIRPSLIAMAQRLADYGYLVLLPDLYYRSPPHEAFVPKELLKGDFRATIGPYMAKAGYPKAAADTAFFLAYLDSRGDLAGPKIGVTGYCMGGAIAITAAGMFPDRIAAAASFHGGQLATDKPESPSLLVPQIKAEVYVGVADNDASYPPDMGERFVKVLDEAGVIYRHELYPGALHGWTQTDFPIYDEAAAERHWDELIALFKRTIG
jgi:carboxymethylenebutenolidase